MIRWLSQAQARCSDLCSHNLPHAQPGQGEEDRDPQRGGEEGSQRLSRGVLPANREDHGRPWFRKGSCAGDAGGLHVGPRVLGSVLRAGWTLLLQSGRSCSLARHLVGTICASTAARSKPRNLPHGPTGLQATGSLVNDAGLGSKERATSSTA